MFPKTYHCDDTMKQLARIGQEISLIREISAICVISGKPCEYVVAARNAVLRDEI